MIMGLRLRGGIWILLKGRMDFEFETMRRALVAEIEGAVNAEVAGGASGTGGCFAS